jgi:tight adherence protein B
MVIESIYLLYGAIFLATLLLVEGLYLVYTDTRVGRRAVNRRMGMLASGSDSKKVFERLRRKPVGQAYSLGSLGRVFIWFDKLISQSGLLISTGRMLLLMAGLIVAAFLFFLYALTAAAIPVDIGVVTLAIVASLAVGIVLPILYLKNRRSERIKQFSEQLPDALDIMVRSLQAGHPISAAMGLVTKEMADPIGTEFGITVDEMTYGLDLRDALQNMGRRLEVQDFQYVVVTINIQSETGGNLAEVLQNLSFVIRERFRMFKKIKALSSEGRISAIILSATPFLTGATILVASPTYYLQVAEDPLFLPLMLGSLALMLTGIFVMFRMVNFRV